MLVMTESVTWVAVGLAVGAATLALALAGVLVVWARRRPPAREEVERLLRESQERFEATVRELGEALESARAEGARARTISEIGASIDLDTVLTRTLETARALPGIDAAMIVIPVGREVPLVATLGLSEDEAAARVVAPPPDGPSPRATTVSYQYPDDVEGTEGPLLHGGLCVPLVGTEEDEPIGSLTVFWRRERAPADSTLAEVEALVAGTGLAIENATRFREARQQADLDALTNLHNRRYFHETLAREVARAHRYDRRLALVVLDIDDFKSVNDRVGHLAGDAVLSELAQRVHSVVRSADVPCRVGGDEFAVILPESTLADAEQLYQRLQFAIGARPSEASDRLRLSAGIAELRPDDSPLTFFERADEALYRAKDAGKGQAVAADGRA